MNKMLVSDYDQTFYLNDEDIEKNNIAINKFKDKDNIFVIATGRSYDSIKQEIFKYNINYDYLILNHGSTIIDRNDNILFNFYIEDNVKNEISKHLELNNCEKKLFSYELGKSEDYNHSNITRIHIRYKTEEKTNQIFDIIKSKYKNVVNVYHINDNRTIEIISRRTNKSKAIEFVSNKLNISKENIYTIGDGYSDIEMIRDYNGFCMKNSVDGVLKLGVKYYENVSKLVEDIINEEV